MSGAIRTDSAASFVASVRGKLLNAMSWMQVEAGVLKFSLFILYMVGVNWWCLGREPRVREAEGCRGPSLRDQVQHWQQKTAEVVSFFFWPLVLFNQNVEQTPRLQFGDVTQITWKKAVIFRIVFSLWTTSTTLTDMRHHGCIVDVFTFLGEKFLGVFTRQN